MTANVLIDHYEPIGKRLWRHVCEVAKALETNDAVERKLAELKARQQVAVASPDNALKNQASSLSFRSNPSLSDEKLSTNSPARCGFGHCRRSRLHRRGELRFSAAQTR
jgi:hypothetical protein